MKTILSYGMGVESSTLILRWMDNESLRDFDLAEDLIVITAQVGDEYPDQKILLEKHILPRMRPHRIRYVQVARAGHLEAEGIVVLDDTRQPRRVYLDGAYRLSQELRAAGTVPQFAGDHRCSLKFKKFAIELWIQQEMAGEYYRHALGYNAEEQKRVEKSERAFAEHQPVRIAFGFNSDEGVRISKAQRYDTPLRHGWYPLVEWGMNREDCLRYLKEVTGETWPKSACVACPFNALKQDGIARMRQFPEQVAEALLLEHQSLSFNPRGTLYRGRTLLSIITNNHHTEALQLFRMRLEAVRYALYRVRRIYKAAGHADRAVEKLMTGSRAEMIACFEQSSSRLEVRVEHDIRYGYVRKRKPDRYPSVEEFFVVAPAVVESKTRYGFEWFEAKWRDAVGEPCQEKLFE
jgi:hypothetical protein